MASELGPLSDQAGPPPWQYPGPVWGSAVERVEDRMGRWEI